MEFMFLLESINAGQRRDPAAWAGADRHATE